MKDKIIAMLKKLGIVTDEKIADVSKALDEITEPSPPSSTTPPANQPPVDPSKITDPAIRQIFEGLIAQNNQLSEQVKGLITALTEEKDARKRAAETAAEQAKKERDKKAADLVQEALKQGKIPKAKEEWLKKFAEKDLDAATEWVKEAPVDKHLAAEQNKSTPEPKKKGEDQKPPERVPGPLGSVNPTILSKVLEQTQSVN